MAPLFPSFSIGNITTEPLLPSTSNNPQASALQQAFFRRPFALTGADVSSLVSSLCKPDPKSAIKTISTQMDHIATEWAVKQVATGVAIEQLVLRCAGDTWSLLKDTQGQPLSPEPDPVLPNEDVLLVAKAVVGARVRQSASDRTSIAFIGPSGCGKSSLINGVVGFPLITAGSKYFFFSSDTPF
jgi:ABC-type multidrug transport system fused ATPase/permease subunit